MPSAALKLRHLAGIVKRAGDLLQPLRKFLAVDGDHAQPLNAALQLAGVLGDNDAVENNLLSGSKDAQAAWIRQHSIDMATCSDNPSGAACQKAMNERDAVGLALATGKVVLLPGSAQIFKKISNDHFDLDEFYPENEHEFSLQLLLRIESEHSSRPDNFDLHICTPEWLCKHHWHPQLMRHTLMVRKYELDEIKKTITDYIDQCEGNDWREIAQKLSRIFAWEYEDYQL